MPPPDSHRTRNRNPTPRANFIPKDARGAALDRILSQSRKFPDLLLGGPEVEHLDARDAAFSRAIELAAIRRWTTITACLRPHLTKHWHLLEKPIQAALVGGTAQILFMSVPPHAAVDGCVEWTKQALRPGAAGFVNAVLRKIAASVVEVLPHGTADILDRKRRDLLPMSDGSALRLNAEVFSEDHAARLAEQTAIGRELLLQWIAQFGWERAVECALHTLVEPPIIVTPVDDCTDHPHLSAHASKGFAVWSGPHSELVAWLEADPTRARRVQDPTSAESVANGARFLQNPPKVIVDLCAGRGTKTRQLAQLFPNATVLATDPDPVRFACLEELANGHPTIRALDPEALLREAAGNTDFLILDVPCSNTGVLARRPEARFRFSKKRLDSVLGKQRDISDPAIGLLKTGGVLVYATCSIETAENIRQAKRLAKVHALSLIVDERILPSGIPGCTPQSYSDGGFHAVFVKQAGSTIRAATIEDEPE